MVEVVKYFLLFYVYSILGYISEVLGIYKAEKKFIWSRGYLLGPYLPVFGFGSLIVTIFLKNYQNDYVALFVLGMVYCATLEYLTSFVLEKIFHIRWWDYSHKKFHINGRISLETSIFFGLGAIFATKILNPILWNLMDLIPEHVIITIGITIAIILLVDFIISTKEIINLRIDLNTLKEKDATEEIKKKIKESIHKNYYYYERLLKAFPYFKRSDEQAKSIFEMLQKIKGKRQDYEKK